MEVNDLPLNKKDPNSMIGRVCMITGANSGLGKATAAELARLGAHVIMVCRDKSTAEPVKNEMIETTGNSNVDLLIADLSFVSSVRELVKKFKEKYNQLHVLVNNAGVMFNQRVETVDGYEIMFATNYLSHFLLTNLLLDTIVSSSPARIINISSGAHKFGDIYFDDLHMVNNFKGLTAGFKAYGQSKLAKVMFTYELDRRLKEQGVNGVTVNALDPGVVKTKIGRHSGRIFKLQTWMSRAPLPERIAETVIYLATSPEVRDVSGKYFNKDKKEIRSSKKSYDVTMQKKLWEVSDSLTAI